MQCDVEHTRFMATESWRGECDGDLGCTDQAPPIRCRRTSEPPACLRGSATCASASLINKSAEELDSVRIGPLIEALASASDRVEESRDLYLN